MNINSKISLAALAIIASVIASPFVYAAVEPHIILTMDAGQTTNPFTINNNTDYTVFEVEPSGVLNGIISAAVRTDNTEIVVTAANDLTDPVILASWVFDRSVVAGDDALHIPFSDMVLNMHIKRNTGVGNCIGGYGYYDGTYHVVISAGSTSGTYQSSTDVDGESWMDDQADQWVFFLYNNDSATTCSFKNISAHGTFVLPLDITFTRGV